MTSLPIDFMTIAELLKNGEWNSLISFASNPKVPLAKADRSLLLLVGFTKEKGPLQQLPDSGSNAFPSREFINGVGQSPAIANQLTRLANEKDPSSAFTLLQAALCFDPNNSETLVALAWQHYHRHNLKAALTYGRKARKTAPEQVKPATALGRFLLDAEDYGQAYLQLHKALTLDPQYAPAHSYLGVLLYRQGRLEEAETVLQNALQLAPDLDEAHITLGWLLHDTGRFDEALKHCSIAVANKKTSRRLTLLSRLLARTGKEKEAVAVLTQALEKNPENNAIRAKLAGILARSQQPVEATKLLKQGLHKSPDDIELLRLTGWFNLASGKAADAYEASRKMLARWPDDPAVLAQAAIIALAYNKPEMALVHAEKAVRFAPNNGEYWWRLGQVHAHQHHMNEAISCLKHSLHLQPGQSKVMHTLSTALIAGNHLQETETLLTKFCSRNPEISDSLLDLADIFRITGRFSQAVEALSSLLNVVPDWSKAQQLLARCLVEQGFCSAVNQRMACWSKAAKLLTALLREQPANRQVTLNLIRLAAANNTTAKESLRLIPLAKRLAAFHEALEWTVHNGSESDCRELTELANNEFPNDPIISCMSLYIHAAGDSASHRELNRQTRSWTRKFSLTEGFSQPPSRQVAKSTGRLRVAYLASHLHSSLLLGVIAAHDRNRVEVLLYTAANKVDMAKAILQDSVTVQILPEEGLAESLRLNNVDVLVDTVGLYPFQGQLSVLQTLCKRGAPIQCGWLGTWGGGGGLYDALIVDKHSLPPSAEPLYSEEIIRLTGGQWAWTPPLLTDEPGPLPCSRRGHITFGTTVRGFRLSAQTLETWAKLLARIPDAHMELLGIHSRNWRLRHEFSVILERYGVESERVVFHFRRPYVSHLEFFREIDIFLDSFPGNGGLCSLDALWMGVPVLTCSCREDDDCRISERQGASLLASAGCEEWVAKSPQDYIKRGIRLATDQTALAGHRMELRQRLLNSPLVDTRRVAAALEKSWMHLSGEANEISESKDSKSLGQALARRNLGIWLSRNHSLSMPNPEQPDISVVLVLYNQAGLTLQALEALAEQKDISFETIIVDNGSKDNTSFLLESIRGVQILHNRENQGFLQAANQGAEIARGQSILFLNNDTIVQEGSLSIALQRLYSAEDIGIVGGRIVLADGTLQEAGSIIFADGSTIGYGRGNDPNQPEFRFVRDVDYCSGAFLMVRRELWKTLDGFDTIYAPAYYEDTDLCLRARNKGWRVVYEPNAIIAHIENGSAAEGQSTELILRNRSTFLKRHARRLTHHTEALEANLEVQRWANRQKRKILVIDDAVPYATAGSGFVRARYFIQALQEDCHVTLFPLWQTEDSWHEVYKSLPETIEVILGHGADRLEEFLESRHGVYDVILISRPPNMAFVEKLRKRRPELFFAIRIVYDSEALFALRDIAKAKLLGKPMSPEKQQQHIDKEMEQACAAERVLAVSRLDEAFFRKAGYHDVRIVGHRQQTRDNSPGVGKREGMLFVGALNPGTPNEDGLLWFVSEILPQINNWLSHPVCLSIVGECRSNKIAALQSSQIQLLGRVDNLTPLYDKARLFIAPTRYAAGVPAKVIGAAGNGLPVVASALLAEQLGWSNETELAAAGNSDDFVEGAIRLIQDDAFWLQLRNGALMRTKQQFDPHIFHQEIKKAVTF